MQIDLSPELLESLQRLTSVAHESTDIDRTLQTVADLTASTVPGCDSAGVTVRRKGEDITAAASDELAQQLDKLQYDSEEGPCLTALGTGESQQITSLSKETRWPEFCEQAATRGLGSSLSFPLKNEETPGALNMYSTDEAAFDERSRAVAQLIASQATVALQNAQTYLAAIKLTDQLNEAVKSRDLIGQAKGILMEREAVNDGEAFEMLRTLSQTSNAKLREVAQRVVDEAVNHRRSD